MTKEELIIYGIKKLQKIIEVKYCEEEKEEVACKNMPSNEEVIKIEKTGCGKRQLCKGGRCNKCKSCTNQNITPEKGPEKYEDKGSIKDQLRESQYFRASL